MINEKIFNSRQTKNIFELYTTPQYGDILEHSRAYHCGEKKSGKILDEKKYVMKFFKMIEAS